MHLETFLKWKFKKNDIPMRNLNLQFLEDFNYYLKTEKHQQQVTINKVLQRFRAPIKQAISKGFLESDPFMLYKSKEVRKELVFLSIDELRAREDFTFKQSRLKFVKDLLLHRPALQ
jgi:integrase/recombinase XerD